MRSPKNILVRFLLITVVLILGCHRAAWGRIIYVDRNAKGAINGSSWTNACRNLEDALGKARSAEKPVEVRVAQGVWKPGWSGYSVEEKRHASFELYSGVTLKGGYAGVEGEDPDARDIGAYRTILSGDHRGDDVELSRSKPLSHQTNRDDNSRCVVTSIDADETAVLDGFTITGGYHDAIGREAPIGGAGLQNFRATPTVIDCTFVGNCVVQGGGAVLNTDCVSPTFIRCTFQNNYAGDGGAIRNHRSGAVLVECLFVGNYADRGGGGIFTLGKSSLTLTNCRFVANLADSGGGVFSQASSDPIMTNCLFAGNFASKGAGLFSTYSGRARLSGCIFWDNRGPAVTAILGGSADIRYSDIQGGWPGPGNLDTDPRFVRTGYWATPSDPNLPGDPSPVWVDGDYHLKSQAGRWDPASESWVKDDVTSPCIDAGDPNSPIGQEPFPNGGRVNMGAYGGTAEASKSYFGEPIAAAIIAGDINGDGKVDWRDFAILSRHWLQEHRK